MNKNTPHIVLCFLMLLGLSGCHNFKHSKLGIQYHNLTARFNPYFNGKEKLKEVENNLYDQTEDNYTNVIAVYPIGTESGSKSAAGDLDYVNKKGQKIIIKHDVSSWVDDAHVLIGKSYYYKRDYFAAMESFQYVTTKYPKTVAAYEAQLWTTRCLMELNKLNEAQAQISVIKGVKTYPENLKSMFNVVQADYYVRTGEYKTAADRLSKGLHGLHNRKYKIRYYFILAQLYTRAGNLNLASFYYRQVIKRLAPYELAFQARMGLADTYEQQDAKNKRVIKRTLANMVKDEKNKDFLDQIYYQMAKIAVAENNSRLALEDLHKSARLSTKNKSQKTLSYYKLGDVYTSKGNFVAAKLYYDSAIAVLPKDFPKGEEFGKKLKILSDLSEHLGTIKNEDSLQTLASMDAVSLDKYITKVILTRKAAEEQKLKELEKLKKDQDRKARYEEAVQQNKNDIAQNPGLPGSNGGGAGGGSSSPGPGFEAGGEWYFYNQVAMTAGEADFTKKWGTRANADDWRRKASKATGAGSPGITGSAAGQSGGNGQNNLPVDTLPKLNPKGTPPKDGKGNPIASKGSGKGSTANTSSASAGVDSAEIQKLKVPIPFEKQKKFFSNQKIQQSLYRSGSLYFNELRDYPRAAIQFEELLRRFPDNSYVQQVNYSLYKLYTMMGDTNRAVTYKDFILKNYPGSEYALLIKNPDFLRDRLRKNRNPELEALYDSTFTAYKAGNCSKVATGFSGSLKFGNKNYLLTKFDYLNLLCHSRLDSGAHLIDSLRSFLVRYPGDEISIQAGKLIKFLEEKKKEASMKPKVDSTLESTGKKISPYKLDTSQSHFYVMVIQDPRYDASRASAALSDYNANNYGSKNYDTRTASMPDKSPAIMVRNFPNWRQTMAYYKETTKDQALKNRLKAPNTQEFIITVENWAILQSQKDITSYVEFFKNNYK